MVSQSKPRDKFTQDQRVDLVLWHHEYRSNYEGICRNFQQKYPNVRLPDKKTIQRNFKKFLDTGNFFLISD